MDPHPNRKVMQLAASFVRREQDFIGFFVRWESTYGENRKSAEISPDQMQSLDWKRKRILNIEKLRPIQPANPRAIAIVGKTSAAPTKRIAQKSKPRSRRFS